MAASAITPVQLADSLAKMQCYGANVKYVVSLPSVGGGDDVAYDVHLESTAAPTDTLLPFSYLIDWTLLYNGEFYRGFHSYDHGVHFRYRDGRLQQWRFEDDPSAFVVGGTPARGVHALAQFVDAVPQAIAQKILTAIADTTCVYSLKDNGEVLIFEGMTQGSKFRYIFDSTMLTPREFEVTNNPDQISEQTVSVKYGFSPTVCQFSEESISERYPEAFKQIAGKYSLEKGQYLPTFSAPTPTRERYMHERGTGFGAPTVFVFLESGNPQIRQLISDIRALASECGMGIVWAFGDHRAEEPQDLIPDLRPGESLLFKARSAARDCGVTNFPTVIVADLQGRVVDFTDDFNQSIRDFVIKSAKSAD